MRFAGDVSRKVYSVAFDKVRESIHSASVEDTRCANIWIGILRAVFPRSDFSISPTLYNKSNPIESVHDGDSFRFVITHRFNEGRGTNVAIFDLKSVDEPFEPSADRLKQYMSEVVGVQDINTRDDYWADTIWGVQSIGTFWKAYRLRSGDVDQPMEPELIIDWKENFASENSRTSMLLLRSQISWWLQTGKQAEALI
ncbi:hypothetical protein JAAARDRAFT_37261 [Jaapia argillacea MUCL 33604]|uniref:Uncharacterized protein n=1 Tax=Jaapia argillacea MUCL 33604 TaxID=933084 RepID=A0A067PX24_9AGAM|nr:hypothetical protein JAAARDRAFT_37261 [Jaapia argillacea MUCL 33604]